ncbi:hypothetical protein BKA64DRAFT_231571 [Cadophora sp. MPI-SDFR-AT-0126]|nr:hypothetical protein BKA64DRAFT_231571 [Leotiomycetes sp. MPI-SDFR-AT-0126]
MARTRPGLRTRGVWRGGSYRAFSRDSSASPPSPPQLSSASPPSVLNGPGMPRSWDTPLSPTEQDDDTGIIPFKEFEDIREEVAYPDLSSHVPNDDINELSAWDTLLAAAPLPESVEVAQSSNGKDPSGPTPPNSDSQGPHQILISKAVPIPIAASGDGGNSGVEVPTILGPIRDASVLIARGKIAAVLKVLVAELEEKEETKAGVKRSFTEFHRDSSDCISDLVDTAQYEYWIYKGLARSFKSK